MKMRVMEHLESTEKARLFVEESLRNQETADELDPEGEQEKVNCEFDGTVLHPDFKHLNPDDLDIQDEKREVKSNLNL